MLAEVGYVAQGAPLYRSFTVADTIELARRRTRAGTTAVAERRSRGVALEDEGRRALRGGARAARPRARARQAAAARLLDEPFAGLDPLAGREFLQLLMDGVAETAATVVIASHVIADIERVCDHIVLLTGGGVRLEGNVEELLESHRHPDGPAPAARRDPRRALESSGSATADVS